MAAYDLIGDIHGHASELRDLLEKLGYQLTPQGHAHPEGHQVIFCGDLIDRGPQIREVLQIVKPMVEHQQAQIVMGNHEYNIVAYHTWLDGHFLRPHTAKNAHQNAQTLKAFVDYPGEWLAYLNWFKSLPLFLELPELRVVHACWDPAQIEACLRLAGGNRLTPEFLFQSAQKGSEAYWVVERLLKGWEVALPEGQFFIDKDGNKRVETRVRWWPVAGEQWQHRVIGMPEKHPLQTQRFEASLPGEAYTPEQKPVFFGHYWLKGEPRLLAANACCLDFSVAKGGKLTAYCWRGEAKLRQEHLVWVEAKA